MTRGNDSPGPYHGGDLDWAERRFGRPADGWIDLSTGINPWPYPIPSVPREAWTRLPTAPALHHLLAMAAARYDAPSPETVIASPGTQPLIRLLPRLWPARGVAIVGPTYGEHRASWRDAGHTVIEFGDPETAAGHADIVVLTNPNNPDGRRFDPRILNAIAGRLAARGGLLIVDEAFGDLTPELSLAPSASEPGRLILRSFGKFYGLAGLRLGFAITNSDLAGQIRNAIGAWPVSGPAMAIGALALADREWSDRCRTRLAGAGDALRIRLQEAGFEIAGGTDLFVLAARSDAGAAFEQLGHAGIFVRHFPDRPDHLRFGLPADPKAESRLTDALTNA